MANTMAGIVESSELGKKFGQNTFPLSRQVEWNYCKIYYPLVQGSPNFSVRGSRCIFYIYSWAEKISPLGSPEYLIPNEVLPYIRASDRVPLTSVSLSRSPSASPLHPSPHQRPYMCPSLHGGSLSKNLYEPPFTSGSPS